MARPPRSVWVHKGWHKYHYLPRVTHGPMKYDYEEMEATPEKFEYKLDGQPPKLWVAWLYRYPRQTSRELQLNLEKMFGELATSINKMRIFKNTPYWNNMLWRAKPWLEIRPITFPHGEPTDEDINYTTLLSNGECVVDKNLKIDTGQLTMKPDEDLKQFPRGYIPSKLLSRWQSNREIQEDDVWSDPNKSRW